MKRLLEVSGKIILSLILLVVFQFAGFTLLFLVMAAITGQTVYELQYLPVMEGILLMFTTVGSVAAVLAMYGFFERKRRLDLGWLQSNRSKAFTDGTLWGILFISAAFLAIRLFGGIRITGFHADGEFLRGFLFAVLLFFMVAVSEELLCRGYWYGLIRRSYGVAAAITVTSALFAALHLFNDHILQNPVPVINLFLAGIFFGVARHATGGLWAPIGIHFTWNLFQGNVYGFAVSGLPMGASLIRIEAIGHPLISGGLFGAEGSILTGLLIIVFTVLIYRRYGRGQACETPT